MRAYRARRARDQPRPAGLRGRRVPARPHPDRRRPVDRRDARGRHQRRDGDRGDPAQQPSPPARRRPPGSSRCGTCRWSTPSTRRTWRFRFRESAERGRRAGRRRAERRDRRRRPARAAARASTSVGAPAMLHSCAATRSRACASAAATSSTRTRTSCEDRLGEMLVRRGLLSQADLVRATEIVVREKRRLGEVLAELGLLDTNGLEDAIALHVHEMLARALQLDGRAPTPSRTSRGDVAGEVTLKLSTGELILEAVRAVKDPDVVRYALGDIDRVLALSSDPLLRFQKLTLSPTDGFVLSRIDGTTERARDPADDPAAGRGDAEEPVRPALDRRHRVRREAQAGPRPRPRDAGRAAPDASPRPRRPRPPPRRPRARSRRPHRVAAPPPGPRFRSSPARGAAPPAPPRRPPRPRRHRSTRRPKSGGARSWMRGKASRRGTTSRCSASRGT